MLDGRKDEKLRKTSLFLLKLLFVGIMVRAIIFLNPDTYTLQVYLAELTKQVVNIAGLGLERDGIVLLGSEKSFIVVQDCLGWKSLSLFIGLVFASTKNILKHWKILFAGATALIIANIVRVITTVYLSYLGIVSFDIIHTFLWRWGLALVVLLIWLQWFRNLDL